MQPALYRKAHQFSFPIKSIQQFRKKEEEEMGGSHRNHVQPFIVSLHVLK
jgi:hypothetical protein